jgi:hypothetical protein
MTILDDAIALSIKPEYMWAKESTMLKILAKLPGREPGSSGADPQQVLSDTIQKAPVNWKKTLEGVGTTWTYMLKSGISGPSGIFDALGRSAQSVSGNLQHVNLEYSKAFGTVAVVLETFSHSIKELFKVNKVFLDVYESGARLEGGMTGLMRASMASGQTVEEFGSLLVKHSSTVAILGAQRTPELIKRFQELTGQGGELMATQGQANEMFLQTADIIQNSGDMVGMSNDKLIASSKGLIKETSELSKETGQSRKSILDFVSSVTKSGSTFLLTSTLSEQGQKNFRSATIEAQRFGQTAGKMLIDNIQKMVAGGGGLGLLDDNFRTMAAVVPGGVDALQNLQQAIDSGDEKSVKSAMEKFGSTMANAPKPLREQLMRAMPEIAGVLGDFAMNEKKIQDKRQQEIKQDRAVALALNITEEQARKKRTDREEAQQKASENAQQRMNNLDSATNELNTQFRLIYANLAESLLPALNLFATFLKKVSGLYTDLDKKVSNIVGQEGGALTTGLLGLGAAGYVTKKGYNFMRRRSAATTQLQPPPAPPPLEPPTPPHSPRPPTPNSGRFSRLAGKGAGLAAVGGIAGNLAGEAIGGTAGTVLSGAATGAALGASIGSIFPGAGTAIGAVLGGLAGGAYSYYESVKDSKKEEAASGLQRTGNPLADIDAILEGREGINVRYTESGRAMSEFSRGYKEVVAALNLGIDSRNLTNFSRLQDLITGRSGGLMAGDFAGMNLAQLTQTHYESSSSYYDRSLEIWRDIRNLTQGMREDVNNLKGMVDTYLRNSRVAPAGSPQAR